jgi:hypothetical protein
MMHSIYQYNCVTVYGQPLNHKSKTFYFSFFSVSQDNMANTNALPMNVTKVNIKKTIRRQ